MDFKHGSLFSGIGGFDLAAEWMGWENVFHCEISPFCKQLLKYYWPNAQSFDNIKSTDFTIYRGKLDILTGGFPCQPYSSAGKRKGKDDERHLWPEMLRAIREIQPRWIVGKNVLGLTNWNGGLVFDEVQADLETAGYKVWAYVLPACAINAPHRRDRVWFVAYAGNYGRNGAENRQSDFKGTNNNPAGTCAAVEFEGCCSKAAGTAIANPDDLDRGSKPQKRMCAPWVWCKPDWGNQNVTYTRSIGGGQSSGEYKAEQFNTDGKAWRVCTDTSGEGFSVTQQIAIEQTRRGTKGRTVTKFYQASNWDNWPTQSPVCNGDDGISSRLDFAAVFENVRHPRQPARAFGKWRNESIKGGGNAIVPPLVYQIYKAIEQYEATI